MLESFDMFIKNFKKFYYEKVYIDCLNLEHINFNIDNVHNNANILFYPQTWFITNDDNKVLVDKLIKLENVDKELQNLFNLTTGIPKINVSCSDQSIYLKLLLNHENYSDIKEIFRDDFRYFKLIIY